MGGRKESFAHIDGTENFEVRCSNGGCGKLLFVLVGLPRAAFAPGSQIVRECPRQRSRLCSVELHELVPCTPVPRCPKER